MSKKAIIMLSVITLLLLGGQGALAYLYWVRPPGSTQIVTVVKDKAPNTATTDKSSKSSDPKATETPAWMLKLDKFTTNLADQGPRQRYVSAEITLGFALQATGEAATPEQDKIKGTIPGARSVILEQLRSMTTAELLAPDASKKLTERLSTAIQPMEPQLSAVYVTDLIVQ